MEPSPGYHIAPAVAPANQNFRTQTSDDKNTGSSHVVSFPQRHFPPPIEPQLYGQVHGTSIHYPDQHAGRQPRSLPPALSAPYLGERISRPPTPPHQDGEDFGHLRQWHARQSYTGFPPVASAYSQYPIHVGGFNGLPYTPHSPEELRYQHPPSQNEQITVSQPPPYAAIWSASTVHPQYTRSPPVHEQAPVVAAPPIQQWPTHNLSRQHQRLEDVRAEGTQATLSPGEVENMTLDKKSRKKQENLRRRGEALRRRRSEQASDASKPRRKKRKQGPVASMLPSIQAPARARPLAQLEYDPSAQYSDPMDWTNASTSQAPRTNNNSVGSNLQQEAHYTTMSPPNYPQSMDHDDFHQDITESYEAYKWSITLYELHADRGYPFAQSFLEDLFLDTILGPSQSQYKWHAHCTRGFIKDGTRLSFLVLHNAADPFTWGSRAESTTTIGVYGRYWHTHSEIHWKTFTPSIPQMFQSCLAQNFITLKYKWRSDMSRAADRRFHRAYWLAANMQSLGGLLNHTMPADEPHDALDEEFDDGFEVSEEDLQSQWEEGPLPDTEAEEVWKKVVEDIEFEEDVPGDGYEHVDIGGTERGYSA